MNSRIVVVGCGLVGSAVVRAAQADERKPKIVVMSRSIPEHLIKDDQIDTHFGDLGSGELTELVQDNDIVVLASGNPDPRCTPGNVNRLLGPSATSLTEVIQMAAELNNLRIVLVSSGGSVYGAHDEPVPETQTVDPKSIYGAVKASEECMLRPIHGLNGHRVTIARVSTVYGNRRLGSPGQGLVQLAIDNMRKGEDISLFGHGLDRRGYLLDDDLGRIITELGLAEQLNHHTFNVCSGEVLTGADVIDQVSSILDVEPKLSLLDGQNHHIVLDNSRLTEQFPNIEFIPFIQGAARVAEAS